ncbi:phenazine antibiotic biosynthesis protein [Tsukamurella sp. 8F]|uniref:AMP-binding protein n=1 Tax=unclassified Tsukamurella TaxID=2633480 RepID=UPI0023B88B1D|nr:MULTISPECIES: AMP-binding protein [unclassified Tsukamurella]MDF0532177.1 phenazine antibiotic biosynthesis protein [Tsukamurella sp. 8J]MDF0589260.1 phenazine antibiotic biosynthesis protein [Tsukamurella sp. 8F]
MADFSLLDVPRDAPPDPEAYLRAAVAWHFGEETGSPFWLRAKESLGFDPVAEIRTHADLRRFPDRLGALRDAPIEDLVPRGYGDAVPLVFESGGTTGAPKRTAQLPDWVEQVTRWQTGDFARGGFVSGAGLLGLMPSGPHGVGYFSRAVAGRLGSAYHTVDFDPRWAKRPVAGGSARETYIAHLAEQARHVIETQNIANLHVTPPLLTALARDDGIAALIAEKVRFILLSGAHVDADTLDVLRDLFPDAAITMVYGSTMILSQCATRDPAADVFVFDPRSPYVTFRVVDGTGEEVPYGMRGRVVMNHVSRSMFIPNNLERDTAVRVLGPDGAVGDSVSDVTPVEEFEGERIVEGVY